MVRPIPNNLHDKVGDSIEYGVKMISIKLYIKESPANGIRTEVIYKDMRSKIISEIEISTCNGST